MYVTINGVQYSLQALKEVQRINLEKTIQRRLQERYFGPSYTDVSLSKYVVVMLSNNTERAVIAQSLGEFLRHNAPDFSAWLFSHLDSSHSRYSHLLPLGNHSNGIGYPEHGRHIRSAVNLPNNNPAHAGGARPAKDWYGDQSGQDPETLTVVGEREDRREDHHQAEVEKMSSLIMSIPMNAPHPPPPHPPPPYNNNRNMREPRNRLLPPNVQHKVIAKGGVKRRGKSEGEKERRRRKRRRQYEEQYAQQTQRLVVTINGRPVDSINADHPQVERLHSERANGLNPNSAAFYAATPKSECSVLVKGLPATVTNANIRAHFAPVCGPVPRVSILKRPISGENSNLAWVFLKSEKAAEDALTLNGSTMLRQIIEVWPKESEAARQEVTKMNRESMDMYLPPDEPEYYDPYQYYDPYGMFGWEYDYEEEPEVDWSRFQYIRQENGGAGGAGGGYGGGGAAAGMEVQRGW